MTAALSIRSTRHDRALAPKCAMQHSFDWLFCDSQRDKVLVNLEGRLSDVCKVDSRPGSGTKESKKAGRQRRVTVEGELQFIPKVVSRRR